MLVYTNGVNETYSDSLLPVLKEYMDSGSFNDLHPAIVNVTFKNETVTETEPTTTQSSGGIQNPALFAILGVGVVALIIGFVVWKKKKDKPAVDDTAGEGASNIVAAKSLPTASIKEQVTVDLSGGSNDSLRDDLGEADKTFEVDSDEEEFEEYEC
jgi:LPXTG-motif cell wall-anchored protein